MVVSDLIAQELMLLESAADAAKTTIKTLITPVYNVFGYGAVGNGVIDDTQAFTDILSAVMSTNLPATIYIPQGTFLIDNLNGEIPDSVTITGSGINLTTLKIKDNATGVNVFNLANNCSIKNLTIDGNKSNQTVSGFGILGYHIYGAVMENVKVINQNGIGIGLSGCWNVSHVNCEVWYSGDNRPGFWCDVDDDIGNHGLGGHLYENCISQYNDLDGLICNCPNVKIVGGKYNYNGQNIPIDSGALGACGIYNDYLKDNIYMYMMEACYNTESGVNAILRRSDILGCHCNYNDLAGINLRNTSSRIKIGDTETIKNGNSTTTDNPTVWSHSGISFDGAFGLQITNCNCYDDRDSDTQKFGIECMNQYASDLVVVAGNQLKYNITDDSNISSGYTPNITNLVYEHNM